MDKSRARIAIGRGQERSSRAVATLLRLAHSDLADAALLASGRNAGNAPALANLAVTRMINAILATEGGWKAGPIAADTRLIPRQNPLRASLTDVLKLLPSAVPPMPGRDGQAPLAPDRAALHDGMLAARAVLKDLAMRFEVDLLGNSPAGWIEPIRPQVAPSPSKVSRPSIAKRATQPVPVAIPMPKAKPEPAEAKPAPPRMKAVPVPERHKPAVPAVARDTERAIEERSPIERRLRTGSLASTAFWSLMDKWNVSDAEALDLIGHEGGLTKKGTRPRFKLVGEEAGMLRGLQEIDTALMTLGLNAHAWLHGPVKDAPFEGVAPLAYLISARAEGARGTIRFILGRGLRLSMST